MEKGIKKIWANAKFKVGATVTLLAGLVTATFFFVKEPAKKPDAGVVVNTDTILHVQGDSIKADSLK